MKKIFLILFIITFLCSNKSYKRETPEWYINPTFKDGQHPKVYSYDEWHNKNKPDTTKITWIWDVNTINWDGKYLKPITEDFNPFEE